MKDKRKLKMLKEILNDSNLVSKDILKEEKPSGILSVRAEGDSPEEAKKKILEELRKVKLPDEKQMEDMEDMMGMKEEDEYEDEMEDEYEDEDLEEMEEDDIDDDEVNEEDRTILDLLPERSRKQFKKMLIEKLRNS